MSQTFPNDKTVYGPITSWRFGQSLGVDPLFFTSTCSFNCVYCQLGHIQNITSEYKAYVATEKMIADIDEAFQKNEVLDCVTYSGSGEPSLATNLPDVIQHVKEKYPDVPQVILTNGTHLHIKQIRNNLLGLDRVIIKLDAVDENSLKAINRPAKGITFERIVAGIMEFKKEYRGKLEIQMMLMPMSQKYFEKLEDLIALIKPDVLQLNTPKRPYPLSWHRENRGNHLGIFDYEVRELKTISREEAKKFEDKIREKNNIEVLSVYND